MICRKYSFQKLILFSLCIMCYMLLILTQMVFFREVHVFLQLSWIVLYGANMAYLHLENCDLLEVFLSKTNSILLGNNVVYYPFLTWMIFFQEIHVFLQLSWIGLSRANRAYPQLENDEWQEEFFQNLSQFSQGNKVLDAPASNTEGFPSRDTCVSST
jgi:hypothetical protein